MQQIVIGEPTTKRGRERVNALLPGGVPKKVRIYDNGGESSDRYTVVFTGNIPGKLLGWTFYLAMSGAPFHPQGVGLHCENFGPIDTPRYSHLGRKITFGDLPADCQRLVLQDYKDYWKLPGGIEYI